MTSVFATNHISSKLQRKKYLETNSQGQPLQGQTPLTYQRYSETGNDTLVYDGSNVLVIDSTLSSGPLTIDFSSMNNYLGRTLQFVCDKVILNNVVLDFGSGELFVPPLTSPFNSTTLTPDRTPAVALLTFYDLDKAIIVNNFVTFPADIIPGGPGQVLTTNAGTGVVDWEDPPSSTPKTLAFKINLDPSNDLNTNTASQVLFDISVPRNDTTLTLDEPTPGVVRDFTVVDGTKYSVSYQIFLEMDPSIALRGFIGINSDIYSYMESALGATGQVLSGKLDIELVPGDLIGIYVGNVAGAISPVTPTQDYHGIVCITQY